MWEECKFDQERYEGGVMTSNRTSAPRKGFSLRY